MYVGSGLWWKKKRLEMQFRGTHMMNSLSLFWCKALQVLSYQETQHLKYCWPKQQFIEV